MSCTLQPWLASGHLVRVLERHSPRFAPVQLFYPSARHVRPALRAFIEIVKARRRLSGAPGAMSPR